MAIVKALAKILGSVAALYLFFRYLGGFSLQQSVVLTLAGLLLYWPLRYGLYVVNVRSRVENSFSPFGVHISPNWYQLLPQFKLITYQEEWHRLCEIAKNAPSSECSVFRSGIFFTVIRPPSDGLLHGLIYYKKSFLTELNICESIVSGEDENALLKLGNQDAYFKNLPGAKLYLRRVSGDYELGLEVDLDWWKELCKSGKVGELSKAEQEEDEPCGTTRLSVATLPSSEFEGYYGNRSVRETAKLCELTDKQLQANGWQRKDRDPCRRDPWSEVEHKYFTVSHWTV